jgi:hypothetical protein
MLQEKWKQNGRTTSRNMLMVPQRLDGSPATAELKAKEIPMGQLPRRIASLVNLVVNTSV